MLRRSSRHLCVIMNHIAELTLNATQHLQLILQLYSRLFRLVTEIFQLYFLHSKQ